MRSYKQIREEIDFLPYTDEALDEMARDIFENGYPPEPEPRVYTEEEISRFEARDDARSWFAEIQDEDGEEVEP